MSTQAIEFEVKKPNGAESLAPVGMGMMEAIQSRIMSGDIPFDALERLLAFQRELKKDHAKEAFVAAMNAFKRNPPVVIKNAVAQIRSKKGEGSSFKYNYASLDTVCKAVVSALSEQGISHRWSIDDSQPDVIRVACILTHELGHSEEATMRGPVEKSDFINALQSRAVTVSYLERYTLMAVTGLAATMLDDDGGNGRADGHMDSLNERLEWIANAKDSDELKRLFLQALELARKVGDRNAEAALSLAKNKRYRELQ